MIGRTCKYIGCENEQQHSNRSCCQCQHKYAGKEKPPSHTKVNNYRKPKFSYVNIISKEDDEFISYELRPDYKKIIAEAREKLPKPQYIDENLNYIPKEDGFKKYSRVTELTTVGKIKWPWDK